MRTIPKTMRAIAYARTGPAHEVLRTIETPVPDAGPGEVLVAVAASGVNPHDTKRRSGWASGPEPARPIVPHGDGAGRIVAVGQGVPETRIGEAVWFHHCGGPGHERGGSLAEYCALPARQVLPLPPGVDISVGAGLGVPALTAFDAVFADGSVRGKTLLVTGGAGCVAGYAIGLAKRDGARVIATVSSREKARQARAFGADATIDYRIEDVAARVATLTEGAGIDRIVEVDFGANLAVAAAVIKPHGVIASYSSSRVREPVFPYYAFAPKAPTIRIVQGLVLTEATQDAATAAIAAACREGALVHPPVHRFAFAQAEDAHAFVEAAQGIGKAVVMISS